MCALHETRGKASKFSLCCGDPISHDASPPICLTGAPDLFIYAGRVRRMEIEGSFIYIRLF